MKTIRKSYQIIRLIYNLIMQKTLYSLNILPFKPISLTFLITEDCNLKCKTCDIWKKEPKKSSLRDIEKMLSKIGSPILWITITGGEPFSRNDLPDIIELIIRYNKPIAINIATNGTLTEKIKKKVHIISQKCNEQQIRLGINVSIDGPKKLHNEIRGGDYYDKTKETFNYLQKIKSVKVGINTTISKYNINKLDVSTVDKNQIYEISQNRDELYNNNKNLNIDKSKIIKKLHQIIKEKKNTLLKKNYYKYLYEYYKNGKRMKCLAATSSTYLDFKGNIYACGVKKRIMGNIMEQDFKQIWHSKHACRIRKEIENCYCTNANNYVTNKIMNLK